ncbi:hypothetical protein ACLBX9_24155 [Methylobacterium sp. A49B]
MSVLNELMELQDRAAAPVFMIDQSNNVTDPLESLIRTPGKIRRAYAQALLIAPPPSRPISTTSTL